MLKGFLKTDRRSDGDHGTNGHGTDGRGTNGKNGANGGGAPAPHSSIQVPADYLWTLEVRQDQQLLGAMHSANPFVLLTYFKEYTVLYGEPVGSYALWLRHRGSERGAPLEPLSSKAAWLDFLRRLDPSLDDHLEDLQSAIERTSMIDPAGRQTHPDAVLEAAFGLD